jgi:endonuclease/exonuclease/phosphatase family metal-dependent hydrolase
MVSLRFPTILFFPLDANRMLVHALTYNIHGLPWANAKLERILYWVLETAIPIVCFQEVFTTSGRQMIRERLEPHGYQVLVPRDEGVSLLPSGLVTAIHRNHYRVISDSFQPFLAYHNVEIFANKGFQRITLQSAANTSASATILHILNTHTQSDEEVFQWTRYSYKKTIRFRQAEQIIAYCKEYKEPVLVIGDFNQESSLHPHLRTLHVPSALPIKKATFFQTGEDLDHVAWMPLQWSDARGGCGFCGKYGPALELCKVHPLPWSDHAPVEMKLRFTSFQFTKNG